MRSNIKTSRNFGVIGYPVPSEKKPNAGLDISYIDGYVKAANKNREHISSKFKMSTLHNFHNELGVKNKKKI